MKKTVLLLLIIILGISSCKNDKSKTVSNDTEEMVSNPEKDNYDKIKSEYKLLGKWEISNSISKWKYPYEIYKKGDEYIGIVPQDKYKTDILNKDGNKYIIKGNEYSEYYIIDNNGNMKLFDKDGELESAGYKAVKMQ